MIEIELNHDIVNKMRERYNDYNLDTDHLPYKKFTILIPYGVIVNKDNAIKSLEVTPDAKALKKIDKLFDAETKVMVEIENAKMDLLKLQMNVHVVCETIKHELKFSSYYPMVMPVIDKSDFEPSSKDIAYYVMSIIRVLLIHLSNPTVYQQKNTKRITVTSKKKKKSKKSNKRYIYKTVYRFMNDNDLPEEKRKYKRTKEGWDVRGFWRHYKNGTKTWVDGYPKGKNRDKANEEVKKAKITRL